MCGRPQLRAAIRLPGERGFSSMRNADKDGIPVEDHMLCALNELADRYRLERIG